MTQSPPSGQKTLLQYETTLKVYECKFVGFPRIPTKTVNLHCVVSLLCALIVAGEIQGKQTAPQKKRVCT